MMGRYHSMLTENTLKRDILNAKTHRRPLVIVEGIDDPTYYEKLIDKFVVKNTYRVQCVRKYKRGSGCKVILELFSELQDFLTEDILRYVRGIIDRDSFYYIANDEKKRERQLIKGIIVLKYYSYETHSFTRNNLKRLICQLTHVQESMIDDSILDFFMNDIDRKVLSDLYYVGLECLRNALYSNCDAVFHYSDEKGDYTDYNKRRHKMSLLNKTELNKLAEQFRISYSLDEIKKLVKGKHLLAACCGEIEYLLLTMDRFCTEDRFQITCKYSDECACASENNDKCCYWKNESTFKASQIYNEMLNIFDLDELNYLVTQLKQMRFQFLPQYEQNS